MLRLEYRDPRTLEPNPLNWRSHPEEQKRLLSAVLDEIGYAGALLYNEQTGRLIDGHARREDSIAKGIETIPVLIGSWTEAEEKKILATFDPISAMAGQIEELRRQVMEKLETENDDLQAWINETLNQLSDTDNRNDVDQEKIQIETAKSLEEIAPSKEEIEFFNGKKLLIQFSGGKDSSASAIWCKHFFPNSEMELVFIDIGADFIGLHLFLDEFSRKLEAPLKIIRSGKTIFELLLNKKKWPSFFFPFCQSFLHNTMNEYFKTYDKNDIIIIQGGTLSQRSRFATKVTSRAFTQDQFGNTVFRPIFSIEKEGSGRIVTEFGFPIWEGYSYGLQRTACRCCPGQRPVGYAAIRENFTDTWNELNELEKLLGAGAWQRQKEKEGARSFEEMADIGQKAFESGEYLRK